VSGASAFLFANQVFPDVSVNPYYESFGMIGNDYTIDGDDLDGDGSDESNNDKITPLFANDGTGWAINPDVLRAPALTTGC
jgi:hypothetical protein